MMQSDKSTFIRVNTEYAEIPNELEARGVSIPGDIGSFIEGIAAFNC